MTTPPLIFDLDGTLVDSLPGIAASLNRALTSLDLPTHPVTAVRGFVGNGSRVLASRAAPPGSQETLVIALEQAFKSHYADTWTTGTTPYPGIPGLLATLTTTGHPLAVLSNKPDPFTVAMVAALFPQIEFAAVVGQRPNVPHKPDPTGALEIARLLNTPPGQCWLIGDSTVDILTAKHAGTRCIAVTWGYHDRSALMAAGPDAIVDSPSGLAARILSQ